MNPSVVVEVKIEKLKLRNHNFAIGIDELEPSNPKIFRLRRAKKNPVGKLFLGKLWKWISPNAGARVCRSQNILRTPLSPRQRENKSGFGSPKTISDENRFPKVGTGELLFTPPRFWSKSPHGVMDNIP